MGSPVGLIKTHTDTDIYRHCRDRHRQTDTPATPTPVVAGPTVGDADAHCLQPFHSLRPAAAAPVAAAATAAAPRVAAPLHSRFAVATAPASLSTCVASRRAVVAPQYTAVAPHDTVAAPHLCGLGHSLRKLLFHLCKYACIIWRAYVVV